jgi:DNA-directed RNA polymerase subunit RPC12/RpoP
MTALKKRQSLKVLNMSVSQFPTHNDVVRCPYCSEVQSVSLQVVDNEPMTYDCRKCQKEVSYLASAKEVFND